MLTIWCGRKIVDAEAVRKSTVYGDDMGWRPLLHPSAFIVLTDEEEVRKYLTRHSKADASMKLTTSRLKGQCKLTTLIKGYLPPTYRVYKEITCSPRLVKSKGIPIRKGSRKICPQRDSKKEKTSNPTRRCQRSTTIKSPIPSPTKVCIIYPSLAF